MPRPARSLPLAALALFAAMLAVRFLPPPWWQRLLGPLFFTMGLFAWIGFGHAINRCRREDLKPWLMLAGAWALFALLRWRFPPIPPPPQDPFVEKLPVLHLDWHTLVFAWLPLAAFVQALSDFSRRFAGDVLVRNRPWRGLLALAGVCAALPGVVRPLPALDFYLMLPVCLVAVIAFALPALAHSGDNR